MTGAAKIRRLRQHGLELTPRGTLLLYDNGGARRIPPQEPQPEEERFSRAVEYRVDTDVGRFRQQGQDDLEHQGDVLRGKMRLERGFVHVLLDEQELRRVFFMDEKLVGETPGLRTCRLDERFELLVDTGFVSSACNSTSDDVQRFLSHSRYLRALATEAEPDGITDAVHLLVAQLG